MNRKRKALQKHRLWVLSGDGVGKWTPCPGRGPGAWVLGRSVLEKRKRVTRALLSWPRSQTPPLSAAPTPAHLVAGDDSACPLVGLVQFVPTVWLLLEPRIPPGGVVIPETGRLRLGDKFYIVHKDERLEDGPGERERERGFSQAGPEGTQKQSFHSAAISGANPREWEVVGGGRKRDGEGERGGGGWQVVGGRW